MERKRLASLAIRNHYTPFKHCPPLRLKIHRPPPLYSWFFRTIAHLIACFTYHPYPVRMGQKYQIRYCPVKEHCIAHVILFCFLISVSKLLFVLFISYLTYSLLLSLFLFYFSFFLYFVLHILTLDSTYSLFNFCFWLLFHINYLFPISFQVSLVFLSCV